MQVYKIKSLLTGLFSSGGQWPRFTKKGKSWTEKGHVSSHLSGQCSDGIRSYKENQCVIICFDFDTNTETEFDIAQWRVEAAERRESREAKRKKQIAEQQLAYAKAQVDAAQRNLAKLQATKK